MFTVFGKRKLFYLMYIIKNLSKIKFQCKIAILPLIESDDIYNLKCSYNCYLPTCNIFQTILSLIVIFSLITPSKLLSRKKDVYCALDTCIGVSRDDFLKQ